MFPTVIFVWVIGVPSAVMSVAWFSALRRAQAGPRRRKSAVASVPVLAHPADGPAAALAHASPPGGKPNRGDTISDHADGARTAPS